MTAFGEAFGQNMRNSGDSLMSIVRIINTLTESTMSSTKRLVCDGNSLTLGTGAPGYSYPSQLNIPDYSIVNLGIGSQRTVTMTANGVANVDTPYWLPGNNRNIVVAWEIINDLTVVSKEQAYLNYVDYCQARKNAGWQVIAVTCIANQTNPLASLTYCNEQIRANWQNYADVLCDLAADSRFQNYNNTTYYTADRVHLNATGYALVAEFVRASVLSLPYVGYQSALKQLCTDNGAAGTGNILSMLNQLSGVFGGLTNHTTHIAALNDISTQNGGTGTHTNELSAWSELSALLNLPEWTNSPFFAVPEHGIDVVSGKAITIYGDSLINAPIENDLTVEYTCSIGSQSGNNFTINHSVAGTFSLNIKFKQSGRKFYEIDTTINVISAANADSLKIMLVGDSLVYLGIVDINSGLDSYLTPAFTLIGSQGTTYKHEGMPGFGYSRVLTDPGTTYPNHFIQGGVFDIPAYFASYSLDTPDYVMIRHLVNDIFGQCTGALTDVEITSLINDSKTLVDAFLDYNANIKVIIGLPTICENSGAGWAANYPTLVQYQDNYIKYMHQMWQALITAYDEGAYSDRVFVSNEAIFLDRNDGYPKTDGVHTNGVHPAPSGYQQLGNGLAATLNYIEALKPSDLTLSLISGGVKIDWTDNSNATLETEIWGKNDSDSYALLYIIAAGTVTKSETIDAVDLRYYKIRGKNGTYFTQFTAEQSIAMLGSELITNGEFSAWTGDNPDGWTVTGETETAIITESSGACRIICDANNPILTQLNKLVIGLKYRFKINIISKSGTSDLRVRYDILKYQRFATTGQKTWYDTADATSFSISRWTGTLDCVFDSVSVKKVLMP